jgi:hypothetical protein
VSPIQTHISVVRRRQRIGVQRGNGEWCVCISSTHCFGFQIIDIQYNCLRNACLRSTQAARSRQARAGATRCTLVTPLQACKRVQRFCAQVGEVTGEGCCRGRGWK